MASNAGLGAGAGVDVCISLAFVRSAASRMHVYRSRKCEGPLRSWERRTVEDEGNRAVGDPAVVLAYPLIDLRLRVHHEGAVHAVPEGCRTTAAAKQHRPPKSLEFIVVDVSCPKGSVESWRVCAERLGEPLERAERAGGGGPRENRLGGAALVSNCRTRPGSLLSRLPSHKCAKYELQTKGSRTRNFSSFQNLATAVGACHAVASSLRPQVLHIPDTPFKTTKPESRPLTQKPQEPQGCVLLAKPGSTQLVPDRDARDRKHPRVGGIPISQGGHRAHRAEARTARLHLDRQDAAIRKALPDGVEVDLRRLAGAVKRHGELNTQHDGAARGHKLAQRRYAVERNGILARTHARLRQVLPVLVGAAARLNHDHGLETLGRRSEVDLEVRRVLAR
eukprot:scaffold63255_cov60-Phaeocystis_antarctica.AAC.3